MIISAAVALLPQSTIMASSARLVSSLRRTAFSSRVASRYQYLRPTSQVRWTGSTSASSEPHQPDEHGGVKGPTASAQSIKFTSESYVLRSEQFSHFADAKQIPASPKRLQICQGQRGACKIFPGSLRFRLGSHRWCDERCIGRY